MTHTPDAWIESVHNGAISDEEPWPWPPEDEVAPEQEEE